MKIAMIKTPSENFTNGYVLAPAYGRDLENFNKLKVGDTYEFEVKRARNLQHHRKFWAILSLVCANSDKWNNPEKLLIALKIKLGYVNIVPGFDGQEIIQAGSIRFEAMDQDAFEKFYNAAIPLIAAEIGCTVEELESNYGEYM